MANTPRTTRFLKAAMKAAEKFVLLNEHECRKKLKRKRQNLTKQETVLQFSKKSKSFANLKKRLPFIPKALHESMRKMKLPLNPAVVADNFCVAESEAGKYYAEADVQNLHFNKSFIDGPCDHIHDFERTNHPDMFQTAIDVFSLQIQKRTAFRRKDLRKLPSEAVLKISDNKVWKIVTRKSELHSVRVPPGVTKIGYGVFCRCNWLQKVVLPKSIAKIGSYSFRWCISLESVDIPSGTAKIGKAAFAGNLSLRSVVVPASVTALGDNLFELCMSLTHVSLPATLKSIPDGAFRYCVNLTDLHLPDSVTHIGAHSFAHCVSLSDLRLPKELKNVSDYAFQACVKISEFKLPYHKYEKVQFGKDVFFECHSLETVLQQPAAPWAFVVWALGKSRNRNNWRITTIKRMNNLLRLIGCFAVEKYKVPFDPNVLSSPYNVPRRRVITPLVPIIIP